MAARREPIYMNAVRLFSPYPHCGYCGRLLQGSRKDFCSERHAQAMAEPRPPVRVPREENNDEQ